MGGTRAPVDLALVALLALAAASFAWLDAPQLLQVPFGLALVLLLPGYAIVSVTHPGVAADREEGNPVRSVAWPDRLVLSVVVSILASIATGMVLAFTPAGVAVKTVSGTLAGVTLLASAIALTVRLLDTPPEQRPWFAWHGRRWAWHETASAVALGATLVALAFAAAQFVEGVQDEGYVAIFVEPDHVVECYPLRYNGTYLHNPEGGERCEGPANLTLVINNHEAHPIDYTLRLEWSRSPGADDPGEVLVRQSRGRLPPLPPEDEVAPLAGLTRQHTEPLDPGPPPYEGLQYLKVHLFIGEAVGTPDQALQLRVQA